MGFAQWFWRLFLLLTALIVGHVVVVALLIARQAQPVIPHVELWLTAAVTIALGGAVIWYAASRMLRPLRELSRQVEAASQTSSAGPALPHRDDVGALSGAFERMQRDLAQQLAQLHGSHERLETVLSSLADGVLAVSPDNTILLANEAARQLLDFATHQAQGRSLYEVTRARPVHEAVSRALAADEPVLTEFETPGSVRRTILLRATRLPGEPPPGVVLVLHDMTELRRLESLRRELVANVSHELKTPLSAIKGYAETLRLGAVNDAEHNVHFVRRIEEQADRLHQLILDMLQIARLESGREVLDIQSVSIAPLLLQIVDQFAGLASAKNITLKTQPSSVAAAALADEQALRTILSNLLDNAIKFTPAGGTVALSAAASEGLVTLTVQDTGIGIADADLARIFERFYCVDKARSRELGGSGLGLSIAEHLTKSLGGNISVESKPGHGSTFRVSLPRADTAPLQFKI